MYDGYAIVWHEDVDIDTKLW